MMMKNKKKIKNRMWGEVKEKEAVVATPAGASLLKSSSGQLSSASLWLYLTNPSSAHWSCTEHLFCPLVSPSDIQRGLTQPLPVPIAAPLSLLSALSPGRQLPFLASWAFSNSFIFIVNPFLNMNKVIQTRVKLNQISKWNANEIEWISSEDRR